MGAGGRGAGRWSCEGARDRQVGQEARSEAPNNAQAFQGRASSPRCGASARMRDCFGGIVRRQENPILTGMIDTTMREHRSECGSCYELGVWEEFVWETCVSSGKLGSFTGWVDATKLEALALELGRLPNQRLAGASHVKITFMYFESERTSSQFISSCSARRDSFEDDTSIFAHGIGQRTVVSTETINDLNTL